MSSPASRRTAVTVMASLLAVQFAWHGYGLWPGGTRVLLVAFGLPLFVLLALAAAKYPRTLFWGGVLALCTFSHGVSEAWTLPGARLPALSEAFLSVLLVLAASWDGLRARRARRPPNV